MVKMILTPVRIILKDTAYSRNRACAMSDVIQNYKTTIEHNKIIHVYKRRKCL